MDPRGVRYLIVNGDDFGASAGINRGIVRAHRFGILSSASLLVEGAASAEAAAMAADLPGLSIGLHVRLIRDDGTPLCDFSDGASCRRALAAQLVLFEALVGRPPTHLDSHHDIHRDRRLLPHFRELAAERGLPLRGYGAVRHLPGFYGRWGGQSHLEQIGVDHLLRIFRDQARAGINELGCHPGYPEADFRSSYTAERRHEVATLCDPRVRGALDAEGIQLIAYGGAGPVGGGG